MAEQIVQNVDIRKILPDENQPRKYFAADRMYALKMSIQKHGIKVPLTVETMENNSGKFLLIDGERRFRAAIELGLDSVPCVIEPPKNETDRLLEQFNIQEQHEAWTPVEKAMALLNLSKIAGKSLTDICEMLDIDRSTSRRYIAFAELADKESFVKNEVPLDYAQMFRAVKNATKKLSEGELKVEFARSDEKKLEHQLTKAIVRGDIQKRSDVTKIIDSFKKNPQLIDRFMTRDNITPAALFLEAKAQGAYHLRNVINQCRSMTIHAKAFLKQPDVKVEPIDLENIKMGIKAVQQIIDLVE